MFDVNVFAVIAVSQAFIPLLIAAKGTIVNIGSLAGKFPVPWQGNYNASKAAVNLLTDQLRVELKPFDVKAINVVTGGVKSKFFDNQPTVKISPDSLYYPGREDIEALAQGALVEGGVMDVEAYAEAVVTNALKKRPTMNQWVGSSSFIVWFLDAFLPHSIWVSVAALISMALLIVSGFFDPPCGYLQNVPNHKKNQGSRQVQMIIGSWISFRFHPFALF